MDIQALRLEGGEAVGDREKLPAYRGQMVEAFPEPEVGEIIGADLIAQEGRELLVLLEEPVLPIDAEGVMSVLELLECGVELTLEFLRQTAAEDLRACGPSSAREPAHSCARRSCGSGSGV